MVVGGIKEDAQHSDNVFAIDLETNDWISIDSLKRDKFPPLCGHASTILKNRVSPNV